MRCSAQGNVVSAVPVWADCVGLVVIAADSKCGGEVVVTVGRPVSVGIDDFRKLGHLAYYQASRTHPLHAHGIVQAGGENLPAGCRGVFAGLGNYDVSPSQAGIKISLSVEGKTANLGRHVIGKGEVLNEVTGGRGESR